MVRLGDFTPIVTLFPSPIVGPNNPSTIPSLFPSPSGIRPNRTPSIGSGFIGPVAVRSRNPPSVVPFFSAPTAVWTDDFSSIFPLFNGPPRSGIWYFAPIFPFGPQPFVRSRYRSVIPSCGSSPMAWIGYDSTISPFEIREIEINLLNGNQPRVQINFDAGF